MIKFKQQARHQVDVQIQGATPFTEIYVVDSRFQRVASFLGKGKLSLQSGTYTFRFQEGSTIRDNLVYVNEDLVVHDYKQDQQLKFFVAEKFQEDERCWDLNALLRDKHTSDHTNPLRVQIHSTNPDVICCELELQQLDGVSRYLPLIMRYDWQASVTLPNNQRLDQLLIHMEREVDDAHGRSMMKFGNPFNLSELSHLALQALNNRRTIVAKDALRYLVHNKWELPWHGVMALHLQTLRSDPDIDLIRIMLNNLKDLYGISNHPDLVAVQWWLHLHVGESKTSIEPASLVPTLSNSWRLLLEADAAFPGQVIAPFLVRDIEPKLASFGPLILQGTNSQLLQRRELLEQQIRSITLDTLQSCPSLAKKVFDIHTGKLLPQVLGDLAFHINIARPLNAFPVTRLLVGIENALPSIGSHIPLAVEITDVLETSEVRRKIQLSTEHTLAALEQLNHATVLAGSPLYR